MAEAADFQGTSASAARRWLRRTGVLLAGAPLVAGLALQPSTSASAQAPGLDPTRAPARASASTTGSRTVNVDLNVLSPSAPVSGDTVNLSGTLTNKSKHAVTDASVGLRVGPVLGGRSAIESVLKQPAFGTGPEGVEVAGASQKVTRLAPGVPIPFTLSVPVGKLKLGDGEGVYQLGVTLTGQTAAQPMQQVLGIERTVLPWQPDPASPRIRTTYLWPLISSTHVTAETGSDAQQTPVFRDDELAKEIAPGGRLQQMLALGSGLDVAWVMDPDLLASVDAMTRNYRIRKPDGTTVPGTDQALAKQWLNGLEKAVAGAEVIALPFGDPDLASLAHRGKNVTGSLSHLQDATDVAALTVETVLHVKPDTGFAWPADGAVDPSIVHVATSAGAHAVIARNDSFREPAVLPYTPTAARPIGGGTTAVVTDAGLSTAFAGDMTRAEPATLAVQKFLAQSLMIRQQAPEKQRSIVVAPQRMPTASQAQTMARALRALQDGGWSQPQGLAAAAKATPDPQATTRVPSAKSYPAALHRQEMRKPAFQDIDKTEHQLDKFKVILTDSSRVVTPFGRAIDRETSMSWRGRDAEASAFRGGVTSYLNGLFGGVRLIDKSDTKLSGRSATIPVTVQNNLVQGADHLTLRLTSTKPTRLKIGDGPFSEQPVKVNGGHSSSVKFTTTANANGPVPVIAQLYTDDGQPYGAPVSFDVDVTEVTPTVMLVIAGGVLLLVLAGFRMYTQRKRLARQQAAEAGQEGTGSAGPEDATPSADSARVRLRETAADATGETADEATPEAAQQEAAGHNADAAASASGFRGAAPGVPDGAVAAPAAGGHAPDEAPGGRGLPSEGSHEPTAFGPEQRSDRAVDTAAESTDPSATGERVDR